MELAVLELFVEVVRQGSFAAVARDRNLDPSSVSRAIARLETELDSRLLQRSTRQLSPTEAGALYFARIEPLVADLQQATAVVADASRQPTGNLRVTASVAFGLHWLVPRLPAFQTRYPELTVELVLTDMVVDLLGDRIDLAIRLGRMADSSLIAQRLMPTTYAVCASPDYLRRAGSLASPVDVSAHNCLRFPLAGFRSRWLFRDRAGTVTEVPVGGQTVASNAIALRQCAVAGMGMALLADWLIADNLRDGTLVNLFPDWAVTATDFNTAAWLVYPSRAYIPQKVRAFVEFLQECCEGVPSSSTVE